MCSHCLWRVAFSLDKTTFPSSSSVWSKYTSTSAPRTKPSEDSMNSDIGITPSDFSPTSTTTKSLLISTTVPFRMAPGCISLVGSSSLEVIPCVEQRRSLNSTTSSERQSIVSRIFLDPQVYSDCFGI
ncbi:Uncharacterised protein [Chlamydia abortus]|nr:Uncharacterised protein [Chlamydia abortus]